MSVAARLVANRDQLIEGIRRGLVPPGLRADLLEFLQMRLNGAARQAESARARSRERQEKIESAIRAAAARVPRHIDVRAATASVSLKLEHAHDDFGLESVPCARVLRRVMRMLWKK